MKSTFGLPPVSLDFNSHLTTPTVLGLMPTIHAFDFLAGQRPKQPVSIAVLSGNERFLKTAVKPLLVRWLEGRGDDGPAAGDRDDADEDDVTDKLPGDSATWSDVETLLLTPSLFHFGRPRVVWIDAADSFVSQHRSQLEKLAEGQGSGPPPTGRLVLDVDSWPSNTRLYKIVDRSHLAVTCGLPIRKGGRTQIDESRVVSWMTDHAQQEYGVKLQRAASELLLQLVGFDLGRADREVDKLSLVVEQQAVAPETVREVVGGWTTSTVWQAVELSTAGRAAEALRLLDQLLYSEQPQALFGQISWSLRRLAVAFDLLQTAHSEGKRLAIDEALQQAGVRTYGGELPKAAAALKQLGRERLALLMPWLVQADLELKGSHSHPTRGRWTLERLVLLMAERETTSA